MQQGEIKDYAAILRESDDWRLVGVSARRNTADGGKMKKQSKRRAREFYVLVANVSSDYWPKVSVTKTYALDEKKHYEKLGYEVELLKVREVLPRKRK